MSRADALAELRSATCSNGAPSARNLLVTVFGDALLPRGPDVAVSVRTLARLLESFGANERLVRTSLSRLVNDGLLTVRAEGRRSFYRVDPTALDVFARADERIYGAATVEWDGSWTIVVVDGTESTAARRARLRRELGWVGLGAVATNVLVSPSVGVETAADVVARVGGFENVLVTRSSLVESEGTLGPAELARRCAALDDIVDGYQSFIARFERYEPRLAADLSPEDAFKLRTLAVATFRRTALADPALPDELLPADWIGDTARRVARSLYDAVTDRADEFVSDVIDSRGPSVSRRGRFVA